MFVNNTKTALRAHTVDKNTSLVCSAFLGQNMAAVLFLAIYRDTVPLKGVHCIIKVVVVGLAYPYITQNHSLYTI